MKPVVEQVRCPPEQVVGRRPEAAGADGVEGGRLHMEPAVGGAEVPARGARGRLRRCVPEEGVTHRERLEEPHAKSLSTARPANVQDSSPPADPIINPEASPLEPASGQAEAAIPKPAERSTTRP